MKLELNSVYPRENFAALDHLIKHYGYFKSQTEYFIYVIDQIAKYDPDNIDKTPIQVINPIYYQDEFDDTCTDVFLDYHASQYESKNTIKFSYILDLSKEEVGITNSLGENTFWSIDRLFDYLIYKMMDMNTKHITLPFNSKERSTIASNNHDHWFNKQIQKAQDKEKKRQ